MSTDYYVRCIPCKEYRYLGYCWGGGSGFSFGHNKDDHEGRTMVGFWIVEHALHAPLLVTELTDDLEQYRDVTDREPTPAQPPPLDLISEAGAALAAFDATQKRKN